MVQPPSFLGAAMTTTRTADARITATLRRSIDKFYEHLNRREFEKCYRTMDPCLRESPSAVMAYQPTHEKDHRLHCDKCGRIHRTSGRRRLLAGSSTHGRRLRHAGVLPLDPLPQDRRWPGQDAPGLLQGARYRLRRDLG